MIFMPKSGKHVAEKGVYMQKEYMINFDVTVSLSHFVINLIGGEGGVIKWVRSFRFT
ncbi:hypothetical protein SAMN05444406_1544 [Caldicoprobacter faecalis]|uniref:Uncharacterized protein n=1 Tax=Caldicoprobacter faecalis TaxID=937334 RepID=A0A1I5YNF8_9FIRM|nr:hypothetical protein SAMN05444406_1544 [Caldicoprobacter faecalis]